MDTLDEAKAVSSNANTAGSHARRVAEGSGASGHVARNHTTGAYQSIVTDGHARQDDRAAPYPDGDRPSGFRREDHIKPLACGGPDAVWNLQWQTIAAARAKDRWELRACGR